MARSSIRPLAQLPTNTSSSRVPSTMLKSWTLSIAGGQGPAQVDPDRLRDPKPRPAGGEGDGDIRRSKACREAAERAVGGAVRVGADHDAAGPDESLLHHQLVADPLLEDVGDAVLIGEVAHDLVQAGRGHSVRGQDV